MKNIKTNQKGFTVVEALIILAIIGILAAVILGAVLDSKDSQPSQSKSQESAKAAEAAESIQFTENAEIENIKKRLELTSDPGLTGFVLLMNEAGQPIMYTGVAGKITSGGKRLTKPFQLTKGRSGGHRSDLVTKSPSDEGTWGSSSQYIFFWTTSGQYIQWNGKYLYSDKPFRTNTQPLVISIN